MSHPALTIAACAIILLLGLASGWLSGSGNRNPWFQQLRKPAFMPPGWAFPVVWTTLYLLMGWSAARVIAADDPLRPLALGLFALQLALNLAWSPLFFAAHRVRGALALIVALDADLLATIACFWRIDPPAALALLPYAAWLVIATALNAAILRLNRSALAN